MEEITPQILKNNGFKPMPDGWLWTQWGSEFTDYISIQFRKNGGIRMVELNFINVHCTIRVSGICTIDWMNQLLELLKIDKQIKQ